jgi:phage baseplate assembly protein gpV
MGEFRSFKSGNWNDVNTWSKYNGSEWINPAPGFPTTSDGPITILNGDTITVTASDSADQIIVASGGFLVINPGVTFLVKDGIGTDLIINGCLMNSGSITKDTSATISFLDGSKYLHLQQNGSIPSATWAAGSTCEITDYVSGDLPSNLNQTFYNFTWNCTGQSATADLGWFNNTINGTVTVKSTGNQKLYLTSSEAGTPNTITINGNIVIEGGQFSSNGSSNSANITINTHGNVDVTGGNFSVSLGTGPTVVWNLYGNFSMSNAATQNSNPSGAKFIFGRTDTLAIGPGNTIIALPIEVSDGATLNIGTNILTGAGIFILRPGATLESSHPGGLDSNIQITGTRIFDKAASYTFNGSAAQVTGKSIPDTVNNLTINNPAIGASVTLLNSVTVNGTLEIKKGALALSGNVLSYGVNGTLKYSGTSMQTSTDTEFPSSNGPKNLLIANTKNVALHASRTILGNLNLSGKLTITVNTLVANSASNTGTSTYVVTNGVGVLKLTSLVSQQFFPVGTSYAYAPIWISNAGVPDTFGVTVNADEAAFGGRIKVKWTISENTEGGGDYAIKFGWMGGLENTAFKSDRIGNARIFFMTDTTEAGTGDYTTQFETAPYSVSRGGITKLGPYAVGKFRGVTGVPDDKGNVPRKFNLSQNFPNPFNPSTTIRYCLPVASSVKVIIYNMLGAKVRTIVDYYNDAGDYSIVWDGTNDQNNLVSSGIYFYCLTSNGFSQTMKMLLVR